LSSEFKLIIFKSETDPVEDLSRLRPLNHICDVANSLITVMIQNLSNPNSFSCLITACW